MRKGVLVLTSGIVWSHEMFLQADLRIFTIHAIRLGDEILPADAIALLECWLTFGFAGLLVVTILINEILLNLGDLAFVPLPCFLGKGVVLD